MTTRTVFSGQTGMQIPVSVDLNVTPLTYSEIKNNVLVKNKPVITASGRRVMNDEWIYVMVPNYGNISINVNRANYCQKVYLMNVSILESIDNQKITPRLKKFIETVSDKLVFIKDNKSYRVYLTKTDKGFDIEKVWPYWANVGTGGIMDTWGAVSKKYGGHPGWDYKRNADGSRGEHKLNVDLSIFGI